MTYKAVAFDLDGTIAETFPVIFDAFRKIVYRYTHQEIDDQAILATFGANEIGMLKKLIPGVKDDILDDFYRQYRASHAQLTQSFSGIKDLIATLKSHGVMVPMVTGKGDVSCRISLETLGMVDQFEPILIGSPKGSNKAANFKKILAQYQLTADQLAYIADMAGDVQACREAGIACYSAAWSRYANVDKLREVNDQVFMTVADLAAALANRI